jgi:hypothetical protein
MAKSRMIGPSKPIGKKAVSKARGTNRRGKGAVQNYANSKSTRVQINDNMQFAQRAQRDKGILVVKEEPIGVIESNNSVNFGVLATYAINPGQATTFPLLSQEAAEYETYEFELLEFFTVPMVSEYATGGQTGEMCIAVNFNASLPQPASQTAALTLEPCDANLPCLPLDIRCPRDQMCKRSNGKFVRTGNLPGQSDIKEYDVGNLFVTGEGLSATQFNAARLFVRYRCRLFTRVNIVNQGAPTNNSVTLFSSVNEASGATTVNTQMLLATVITNGLNVVNTTGSLTIPAGNYLIDLLVAAIDTSSNMTLLQATLYKNGVQFGPTMYESEVGNANALSVSGPFYFTSNGTDTLSLKTTATYSAGVVTFNNNLRITAI